MKLIFILTTLLHLSWEASIADISCPDSCNCQIKDKHFETSCVSYEFIKKIQPKQQMNIVSLKINNASLTTIDLKLKYLKNLNHLDLSNNKIQNLPQHFPYLPKLKSLNLSHNHLSEVPLSYLPTNLQIIDLSFNPIINFPKDWSNLENLKSLHLDEAPIDCNCNNLAIYEQLTKHIKVTNLKCFTPREFHGHLISTVNCSLIKENLLNVMLGDEPGSGLEDIEGTNELNASLVDENEEFMTADEIASVHKSEELEEGSGEEGSGFVVFSESPKACYFNCSTPRPIGINDEKNASPPPSVQKQAQMLFEDILQPEKVTTTKIPETTYPQKEQPENYSEISDKDLSDVETFPTNDTVLGEMERASFENADNKSVYIVVGLIIAFVALLLVYYINKKKNQRKINRNRIKGNESSMEKEMVPLGNSAIEQKPKLNSTPESAPLLNGNGKINDEKPKDDFEYVDLRKSDRFESLTPQPERVTITEKELPDSIPKTPLRIHRQLNSEGEMVTTPVDN